MRNASEAVVLIFFIAVTLIVQTERSVKAQPTQYSGGIRIFGLVNNPINLTDQDLLSLPMVSEVAAIHCVWENVPGSPPVIMVNWTGIPLFYLLTVAETKPEAFKVVFRARPPDDFFDTLRIEDALDPHVILAVKANETMLTSVSDLYTGHMGGYRLVVPGRWGYKWVANVGSIEVVDSDILGTYETNLNQPDDAIIPDAPATSISPRLQVFNVTFDSRVFQFEMFTNSSVEAFEFNREQSKISMNVSVPHGFIGFADFIIQQDMLNGPYSILVDGKATSFSQANVTERSFQFLVFPEGRHVVAITGTESYRIPKVVIEPIDQPVLLGEKVIMNASRSVSMGTIISFEWDFGDGTFGEGVVVSHTYSKEGVYLVVLNVTTAEGFSNMKTFQIVVKNAPVDIALIFKAGLLLSVALLCAAFAYLMLRRRKQR